MLKESVQLHVKQLNESIYYMSLSLLTMVVYVWCSCVRNRMCTHKRPSVVPCDHMSSLHADELDVDSNFMINQTQFEKVYDDGMCKYVPTSAKPFFKIQCKVNRTNITGRIFTH